MIRYSPLYRALLGNGPEGTPLDSRRPLRDGRADPLRSPRGAAPNPVCSPENLCHSEAASQKFFRLTASVSSGGTGLRPTSHQRETLRGLRPHHPRAIEMPVRHFAHLAFRRARQVRGWMRSLIQPLQTSFSMLRRLRQFRAPRIGAENAPPADRSIDPAALSLLRVQLLPSSSSMSKKGLEPRRAAVLESAVGNPKGFR